MARRKTRHAAPKSQRVYISAEHAWNVIENDLDIDELYPDSLKDNSNVPKGFLLEGERIHYYGGLWEDYAITSLGRIIGLKKMKTLSVNCWPDRIGYQLRQRRVDVIREINEYFGIEYTAQELISIYKTNNWEHWEWKNPNK